MSQSDRKSVAGRMSACYLSKYVCAYVSSIELDEMRAVVAIISAGLGISIVRRRRTPGSKRL
jgi:hypothetical protein